MVCSREGCDNKFKPYRDWQRFCSPRCRWAHNTLIYAGRGHRASKDARWYAREGWYRQSKTKLQLRIAANLADRRTEDFA